eukprot:CAMPEP_0114674996 /NCGR_PEP_ID=MMETSP0191-20121206/47237_1 /TAXON_ID=126664 /ORGANISM="Sorites sp." /LENGTH=75 /DNA_ID=CAMNT_0001943439 /DNA_START=51 /DNA_END=278 /DNA_ORIENTATION=-
MGCKASKAVEAPSQISKESKDELKVETATEAEITETTAAERDTEISPVADPAIHPEVQTDEPALASSVFCCATSK